VTGIWPPKDGVIKEGRREEPEMLIYPEGMLAISSQHRQEMLDEAQRWRPVRRARRTRRDRHTASDGATNRTGRGAGADAQPDAVSRRGHIAGWVAAGGRGRVEIPCMAHGSVSVDACSGS
jgi:hypothetical protein